MLSLGPGRKQEPTNVSCRDGSDRDINIRVTFYCHYNHYYDYHNHYYNVPNTVWNL